MEAVNLHSARRFQRFEFDARCSVGPARGAAVIKRNESQALHVELMRSICDDRSKDAFAQLFEHFAPRVKSFLMKGGADSELAEECAQDVMVTVWQKADLFDPNRATASTWIFTIARNKRIDAIRKQNRPEPEEIYWMGKEDPDAEIIVGMQQEADNLAEAIEELPKKQRVILKRAFYGDMTHQEIAAETGLPLGTIKSRIRWALEKLRHKMVS